MPKSTLIHANSVALFSLVTVNVLSACSGDLLEVGRIAEPVYVAPRVCASSPPTAGIEVISQAELEALAGCEVVDGDVRIAPFEGADLSPLRALRAVRGRL